MEVAHNKDQPPNRKARALRMSGSSIEKVDQFYSSVSLFHPISFKMLTILKARAMYMYQAAIPEELSFAKGDILAVLRLQDDGWWEAEVAGKNGRPGLVPSNYLQNC
jgi:hypothetical protein